MFGFLDDEIVLMLLHFIVQFDGNTYGMDMTLEIQRNARSLTALLRSCKRMFIIFCTVGASLRQEMAARAISHIRPWDTDTTYPFLKQVEEQQQSERTVKVLKEALQRMTLHCAGECCERERKLTCRALSKHNIGASLQPLEARTSRVAISDCGEHGFVCCRRRVGVRLRHSKSVELISQIDARGTGKPKHVQALELALDEFGTPQTLKCDHVGTKVAFIRTLHTESADAAIPHSMLFCWIPSSELKQQQQQQQQCFNVKAPSSAAEVGAINAQETWWLQDGRLAALFSTAYLHPTGSMVGASADYAAYVIAVYLVDDDGAVDLDVSIGPFQGKAKMASPSRSGEDVAVLVGKAPVGTGPASFPTRMTIVHNVFSETFFEVSHVVRSYQPSDRAICPSSIGMSPNGDCIVAMHVAQDSVAAEVLIKTAPGVFVSVQNMDVTHWTRVPAALGDFPELDYFENPGENWAGGNGGPPQHQGVNMPQMGWMAPELRLPYDIQFSLCGRFVTILDKRTLLGPVAPNHSIILLDTSLRNARRGVRAVPLAPTFDVAPRSLHWAENGMWLQASHGALRLLTQ